TPATSSAGSCTSPPPPTTASTQPAPAAATSNSRICAASTAPPDTHQALIARQTPTGYTALGFRLRAARGTRGGPATPAPPLLALLQPGPGLPQGLPAADRRGDAGSDG